MGKIGFWWSLTASVDLRDSWHLQATYGTDAYRRKKPHLTEFDTLDGGCLGIDLNLF